MFIKVPTNEFKKAVSIAKKALPKIVIQEERSHILIKANKTDTGSTVSVSATNNDMKARTILNAIEISDEFIFTAEPQILEKLLTKTDCKETVLELNPEDLTLKIYTSDNKKSFTTIQTFPTDKMLTFTPSEGEGRQYYIKKDIVTSALEFGSKYLSALKEDKKQYDFIIINKGIVYAANGMNKMGFFVSTEFKDITNFRIRKVFVPYLISVLKLLSNEEIVLQETEKDTGIFVGDVINGSILFECLNSTLESPKIMTDLIKTEAPYTKVDKNTLTKALDRLVTTAPSAAGVSLKLSGSEAEASLEMTLVSNLKSTESLPCARFNETEPTDVNHVIDYNLFKSVITSFEDKDIKVYINDDSKFFKITTSSEVNEMKYMAIGLGSYSKIVKQ